MDDRVDFILDEDTIDGRFVQEIGFVKFEIFSGDHFDALDLTNRTFPEKALIETEYCVSWKLEKFGFMRYAREIVGNMNNGVQAMVDWNLLLNENGGPYHYRYKGASAPIHINSETKELTLQPAYYTLSHFTKYIPQGSVCLATSSYDRDLTITAFERPDGKIAVVMINEAQEDKLAYLRMSDCTAPFMLEPGSISTIIIEE